MLASAAQGQTSTFGFTGAATTYTVPAGVTRLQVVATAASSFASYGASVQATVTVVPGETLTVLVGGRGSNGGPDVAQVNGGFNGGGAGSGYGSGGSGATDLRRTGTSTGDYLSSRNALLVAGGSGGLDGGGGSSGGAGGTPNGGMGGKDNRTSFAGQPGQGATQTGPGAAGGTGATAGSNGTGGNAGSRLTLGIGSGNGSGAGGGGGGGYYGGGGAVGTYYAAGGGGSSWVMPTGSSAITYSLTTTAPSNGSLAITPVLLAPTLSSLSPTSGPTGSSVTLTGTNLTGATAVTFSGTSNNTVTTGLNVNTAGTSLTVTVPTGATTGNVTVTTAGGTSSGVAFTVGAATTAPTVTTAAVTTFASTTATLGGNATADGGASITDRGVVYVPGTGTPAINGTGVTKAAATPATGTGAFSISATGLTAATQYTVRAYATNSVGTSYGSAVSFTTTAAAPTLTSLSPTSGPVGTSVTLTGTGFTGATGVRFNGTAATTFSVSSATTATATVPTGAMTGNVTITTAGGTSGGITFTVGAATTAPSVTTFNPAAFVTATTATLGGGVTADGGATITERGIVYVAGTGTPTTADTKLTATGTTGSFTVSATGLTASTLYNARAYATNSVGTSYGGAVSFTTSAAAPTALTISTGTAAAPTAIAAGTYSSITVTSTGFATLGGAVVANGPVVVNGGLNTSCQALTGTGSFTLSAGGTLGICDAAGISASGATGAVQLSGSRSFSTDASYGYNGTTDQETGNGLPAAARNLAYANTSTNTLTLTQPVAVAQVLAVRGDGTFETNGNGLTLRSTATGTALLVNSGTAKVTNEVTAERYIDPTRNAGLGYRHLVPSVNSSNPTRDLASGGGTITRNSQYNTSATPGTVTPFPTIFTYDADQQTASVATTLSTFDKGWVSPSPRTLRNTGFTVQLTGGQTLRFTGEPQQGNVPLSLERNLGVAAADGGWNLVGNPYAAPLDFSTVTDAQRTDMGAAVYVYESTGQYVGQYRSYLMPTGANPGVGSQPLAGSGQAFFLRVNASSATGSLNLTDANRVTSYADQQVVRRNASDTRPQVQLALAGSGLSDELTVYATAGATAALDANYDATKLANPTGLNLASLTATGEQLAIDGRPAFTAATSIPLFVGVPAAGRYTLSAAALANLAGTRAELVDNLTNTRTLLTQGTAYAFTTTTTTAPGRFWLNLSPAAAPLATSAAALAAQVLAYSNPSHGRFTILRPAGIVAAAELLNALGQRVRSLSLPTAETVVDLTGLATGVYTLRLTLDGQPITKRLVIE